VGGGSLENQKKTYDEREGQRPHKRAATTRPASSTPKPPTDAKCGREKKKISRNTQDFKRMLLIRGAIERQKRMWQRNRSVPRFGGNRVFSRLSLDKRSASQKKKYPSSPQKATQPQKHRRAGRDILSNLKQLTNFKSSKVWKTPPKRKGEECREVINTLFIRESNQRKRKRSTDEGIAIKGKKIKTEYRRGNKRKRQKAPLGFAKRDARKKVGKISPALRKKKAKGESLIGRGRGNTKTSTPSGKGRGRE